MQEAELHNTRVVTSPSGATCYGCVFHRYEGPDCFKGLDRMIGGTAIPLGETDGTLSPGRYTCARFHQTICRADQRPVPLAAGGACKERR